MKSVQFLLAFLIFTILIACNTEDSDILPGKWKLIRIETQKGKLIQTPTSSDVKGDVILELPEAFPTEFTGVAVCNRFQGAFSTLGGQDLKTEKYWTTYAYCPAWGHAFEERVRKVERYEIRTKEYLYLILDEERMVFKKVK
jgi:heat shock protein HslJ